MSFEKIIEKVRSDPKKLRLIEDIMFLDHVTDQMTQLEEALKERIG